MALFPGTPRQTPWPQLDLIDLPAGAVHQARPSPDVECGYLLLRGTTAVASGEGAPETVDAPVALLCGADPERARFLSEPFTRDRLPWRDAIHGGGGRIATRHLWGPEDFASSWTFVDHALLSRGSSLGRHYHEHMDEVFVVLSGAGEMTIGDRTTRIGPGHLTLQRPGEGHGLLNPCEEHLDFVRVAVAEKGKAFTTIDLHTGDLP